MSHLMEKDSRNVKPFKFSDSFLTGFNSLINVYDKKVEDLGKLKSLIDTDMHHGVCTCSYKIRYITPSDISTFISNLEKAMENHLFKPKASDCDLFAVESIKRFLKLNKCIPFNAPSIMGNSGANIPKGATLDDLIFASESECFNLIVYSKYELDKRIDCMQEDIGRIQNMHYSAAIKAFINRLPEIMDKKASFVMSDSLLANAMEKYIEDMIIFATRLNLTTVLQMIQYAVPCEAYKNEPDSAQSNEAANNADNWDEDNVFFQQESVDSTSVSPVFFVFTKGKTPIISKAIAKATDSEYTHVSVSFDSSLDNMYSFGGSAFRKESIHDRIRKDLDIEVYGTFISKDGVKSMKGMCNDFMSNKTKFDYPALVKKLFGSDKKSNSDYKHICTTFVNKMLGVVGSSLSDKNIPSPEEMRKGAEAKADQVFQLYTGNSKDYNKKKASDKLKSCGADPKSKKFDEVVTECCTGFLKTNDYMITNKIPFNCNMRDVVLQDMHPQFKDTVSALKFIMNDERSPIHQMIVQYYTEPIGDYDPDMIIKMFFGCPAHNHWAGFDTREKTANEDCNMNTDVNWLDKITYGNMFHDGNYRRDGVGNSHVHPIMNSFETIYKLFGGCDNDSDNAKLSNNLIRISRVMSAIVQKYSDGCIPNWEMCRDILSVFGEIFTRNMLRLYYNENHYLITRDQMIDTGGPGYMYAESFILEANGFISQNGNGSAGEKTKGIMKAAGNVVSKFIGWVKDKLAKFLPDTFNSNFQTQSKWFKENGEKIYKEISDAAKKGTYKLPKKKTYVKFKVSFNPTSINVGDIITAWEQKNDRKPEELKKSLMLMFGNNNSKIDDNFVAKKGKELSDAITNMVLYSEPTAPAEENDHPISTGDFDDIYGNIKFMCETDCKQWSDGIDKICEDMKKALESAKLKKNESAEGNNSTDANKNNTDANKTNDNNVGETLFSVLQEVSSAVYTTAANSIVKKLFPENWNNFKGIVDDYNTTKNNNSNANSQQTTEAENNSN